MPVADPATAADAVPFAPWDEFLPDFLAAWAPNSGGRAQHLTIVGPNGQGKTLLAHTLLDRRADQRDGDVVVLATKPRDKELSALARKPGWAITRTWPPSYGQRRVIFWPKFGDVRTVARRQQTEFEPVLADIFAEGNRTVYIDEAFYFVDPLRLDDILVRYWQMGRAQNLLVVAGTQRPRGVPRAMFSECSWFIAFRTADEDELRRVSEIGGTDTKVIREVMRSLKPHEFVVCQTRTGEMVRSKVKRERGTR